VEERKVVTVVFVDLTASTELSALLDPERFRRVMSAYYAEVVEELESLRGRAENFAGDAVLGVFGVPTSRDDDALRAVRASLDIQQRVADLGERLRLPVPLRVRIGVNTGAVAVVADPSVRSVVLGAAVNLAARLQQAAEPGEILLGETTRHLVRQHVEVGPRRDVVAKGFEGTVRAWPVTGLSLRTARRTIPLVNRKRELALLSDTFDRVTETSRAHLVSLFGEPGIGKSRLAEEFRNALPPGTKVLSGRASALEEDETFAPLAEMVRRELGVESDVDPALLREKLEDAVEGACEPVETQQIVGRLGMALGLGADTGEEWKYRVAEVRAGLVGFVTGLARREPVVMIFEDLHLAQPAFLELVEQAVREARRVPLMVLCVARWELLEERPDWAGGIPDALTLYLEPLTSKHSVALALEAGEGLDPETADLIATHAGGNPFFIVETTGLMMHEEADAPAGTVRETVSGRLLPPTVQAVVAARIDRLPADARRLVRRDDCRPRRRRRPPLDHAVPDRRIRPAGDRRAVSADRRAAYVVILVGALRAARRRRAGLGSDAVPAGPVVVVGGPRADRRRGGWSRGDHGAAEAAVARNSRSADETSTRRDGGSDSYRGRPATRWWGAGGARSDRPDRADRR